MSDRREDIIRELEDLTGEWGHPLLPQVASVVARARGGEIAALRERDAALAMMAEWRRRAESARDAWAALMEKHVGALNVGHGHVRPRPDGVRARCGGPGICVLCSREVAAGVRAP